MSGIYHGTKFGFVQSSVDDQMGIALEGRLANASDINLCDGISAGADIPVGYGVKVGAISGVLKPGINDQKVVLPVSTDDESAFYGIVVRTETGHTNTEGVSYVAQQEIATVLRADRVGGRIWVKAQSNITTGGNLYWVIDDDSVNELTAGGFAGSAVASKTVQLANVKVLAGATKGKLALIELTGDPVVIQTSA